MVKNLEIRKPIKADIDRIKVVVSETDLFPTEMLDEMMRPFFENNESGHIWLIAQSENEIVAFAYCEPERMTEGTFNLLAIGVRKSLQGKGIGKKLTKELEVHLQQRQARILIVETMGTPEFEKTRQFYLKNNYVQEARIREFYEPGGDKIVFLKSLS